MAWRRTGDKPLSEPTLMLDYCCMVGPLAFLSISMLNTLLSHQYAIDPIAISSGIVSCRTAQPIIIHCQWETQM